MQASTQLRDIFLENVFLRKFLRTNVEQKFFKMQINASILKQNFRSKIVAKLFGFLTFF